jgi:hypothetical protein
MSSRPGISKTLIVPGAAVPHRSAALCRRGGRRGTLRQRNPMPAQSGAITPERRGWVCDSGESPDRGQPGLRQGHGDLLQIRQQGLPGALIGVLIDTPEA